MKWWRRFRQDAPVDHEIDNGPSRNFDQLKFRLDLAIAESERQQARLLELIRATKEAPDA